MSALPLAHNPRAPTKTKAGAGLAANAANS